MAFIKWIKDQIEWIKGFWNEGDKASNKRLLSTAVVTTFIVPYFRVSMQKQTLEDIPTNWAILIAAILGLNILSYFAKGYVNNTVKEKAADENK